MTTFVTVDGVMQAPGAPGEDTSGSFLHGGWLVPHVDSGMLDFVLDVFSRADAFLLGRKTYEIFAAHWPRVTDPADAIAGALNRLPKHVATKTLQKLDWQGATPVRDVAGEVARLKRQYARELQVHGSGALAQTLMEHDLIDVYHVLSFPILLGTGKRLFAAGTVPLALKLVASRTTPAGVVISSYARAGRPTYGSFALDG